MTISQVQIVDYFNKKIGSGVAKTDWANSKGASNETISSPLLTPGSLIWQLDTSISNVSVLPTSNSSVVTVYRDSLSSSVQTTRDNTASGTNQTWLTNLIDWIPASFGSGYQIKLFAAPVGYTSNVSTAGVALPQAGSGNNDSWTFDYQAGVINFADTNVPTAVTWNGTTGNVVYAVGARYTGAKGITNFGNGLTLGNITIVGNTITGNTGVTFGGNLTATNTKILSTTISSNSTTGALTVAGGAGIAGNLNVGGNLTVGSNFSLTGNIAVDWFVAGKIKSGSVNIPASAGQIYVATNGSDSNNGTMNSPFLTIAAALASLPAQSSGSGTCVHIAPGVYYENNPVTIPQNVSIIGDTLRGVTIIPLNPNSDIFYISGGTYVWGLTVKNYYANAFAYSSSMSNTNFFVSPYIQNITSSTTTGTAVMVDGNFVGPMSTKAMIVGFYTIINQGGYGVRLMNNAYSQLVNIYTIGTEVGIWSDSGSFCTLNGSDNSVGNVGLKATGTGPLATSGNTVGYSFNGTFVITNMPSQPHVNHVAVINGDPNYYSVDTITKVDNTTWQITVPETYTANLAPGTAVNFYQRSEVVASAHTFEYVGAGTVLANALPQYGGIPNPELNVIMNGGGRVTYTATDEKGNFWIGPNLVINQLTGTISGDAFNRSLFALMTPYILSLESALS